MRRSFHVLVFLALMVGVPSSHADDRSGASPNANTLFNSALEYHRAGEMDRAMEAFLKAYQMDGAILAQNDGGLIDGAVNYLQGALQKAPENPELHFKMGEFLNLSGRLADAVTHYEKVAALQPGSQLGQSAQGEAAKLKGILANQKPATPSPRPGADADADDEDKAADAKDGGTSGDDEEANEDEPKVGAVELEKSQSEVKALKTNMKTLQKENEALTKKMDDLQKEFDAYKKQAENWHNYYNIFFSNPANIEALKQGKIR